MQVIVIPESFAEAFSSMGLVFVPETVTGSPFLSLTVALYGRLSALMLPIVRPVTLVVHLAMLSAVTDSVAVPRASGFLTTLALKLDDLQVTVIAEVPDPITNFAVVPFARLAFRTAPVLTAGPWTFLMVSTWELAPGAASATIGIARTAAEAAATAR